MSVLQSNSGTQVNVTNPASAAWSTALTVGSVVVVTTFNDSGTANYITGLSGGGVTTWTRRYGVGNIDVWSGVVTSAVTTAVTFGFSASAASRIVWLMQERNDIDATTPFDKISTVATGTGTTATSATSGTLTNANSIVIGHVTMAASATASLGSGYADLTQAGATPTSARFAAMESKTVAVTTATTASFGLSASVAWSCLVSAWKAAATGTNYTATPVDPIGITDSATLAVTKAVTDVVGLTDGASATQANDRSITDVVGITDSVSAILSLDVPSTDPIGITDSVSTVYSIGYQAAPVDPIGITDSAPVVQGNVRSVTDNVGLTDTASVVQANVRSVTDVVGLTDSVSAVRGLATTSADTVGITDSVTAIITDEHAGEWQYVFVPWETQQFTIPDLTPGAPYDIQIRAMDSSGNASPWSDSEQLFGALDTSPPSTPAAPTVVASAIAFQVASTLGKASGGTYNLESDLALLEVHASGTTGFTPTTATKIGTIAADAGLLIAAVPAVATFKVDATVLQYVRIIAIDKTGNRSPASATATVTPGLIDSAHISDLTASKITAGTIGADIIVGARIKTANSGARVELNTAGLQAFESGGTQTVGVASSDGSAFLTGTVRTGTASTRIEMIPNSGAPVIRFYPSTGTNYAFLNAIDSTTSVAAGLNSSAFGTAPNDYQHRVYLQSASAALQTFHPTAQTPFGGLIQAYTTGASVMWTDDGDFGGTLSVADATSILGVWNVAGTSVVSYFQAGQDENLHLRGKFPNGSAADANSALITQHDTVGAGFSGVSVAYGFTMSTHTAPMYTIGTRNPDFFHCISANSNTGATIGWGPTDGTSTFTAKEFWLWAYRTNF